GAGGEEAVVAVAAAGVEDFDFDVAGEAVVLQAVVADDDVAAGGDQRLRGGDAVAVGADPGAGAARDQQRFVAGQRGVGVRRHPKRLVRLLAAVAAGGDAGLAAFGLQAFDQSDHQRRLAAAAGDEVTDDDHGHTGLVRLEPAAGVEGAAGADHSAVYAGQQAGGERWLAGGVVPPRGGCAAGGHGGSRPWVGSAGGGRPWVGSTGVRALMSRAARGTACRGGGRRGRRGRGVRRG